MKISIVASITVFLSLVASNAYAGQDYSIGMGGSWYGGFTSDCSGGSRKCEQFIEVKDACGIIYINSDKSYLRNAVREGKVVKIVNRKTSKPVCIVNGG